MVAAVVVVDTADAVMVVVAVAATEVSKNLTIY